MASISTSKELQKRIQELEQKKCVQELGLKEQAQL